MSDRTTLQQHLLYYRRKYTVYSTPQTPRPDKNVVRCEKEIKLLSKQNQLLRQLHISERLRMKNSDATQFPFPVMMSHKS